jgi:hypothetical protein
MLLANADSGSSEVSVGLEVGCATATFCASRCGRMSYCLLDTSVDTMTRVTKEISERNKLSALECRLVGNCNMYGTGQIEIIFSESRKHR